MVENLSMSSEIPLSEYCPLQKSRVDADTRLKLRDRAAELFYRGLVEAHAVSTHLHEEFGIYHDDADLAVACLHKIMRRTCATCDIGVTTTGNGVVARES